MVKRMEGVEVVKVVMKMKLYEGKEVKVKLYEGKEVEVKHCEWGGRKQGWEKEAASCRMPETGARRIYCIER